MWLLNKSYYWFVIQNIIFHNWLIIGTFVEFLDFNLLIPIGLTILYKDKLLILIKFTVGRITLKFMYHQRIHKYKLNIQKNQT